MPQSPSSAPSPLTSKSVYYSSLPWFRRWLAVLNWRPVVDYELREIEYEKRRIAHEQKMRQLDELDSKLDALLCSSSTSSSTSSTPPLSTPDNSEA